LDGAADFADFVLAFDEAGREFAGDVTGGDNADVSHGGGERHGDTAGDGAADDDADE